MIEVIYEDFCKEMQCMMYSEHLKLASYPPSSLIKRQKEIVKLYCRKCPNKQKFDEWIKTKDPSHLAKKLFGVFIT